MADRERTPRGHGGELAAVRHPIYLELGPHATAAFQGLVIAYGGAALRAAQRSVARPPRSQPRRRRFAVALERFGPKCALAPANLGRNRGRSRPAARHPPRPKCIGRGSGRRAHLPGPRRRRGQRALGAETFPWPPGWGDGTRCAPASGPRQKIPGPLDRPGITDAWSRGLDLNQRPPGYERVRGRFTANLANPLHSRYASDLWFF